MENIKNERRIIVIGLGLIVLSFGAISGTVGTVISYAKSDKVKGVIDAIVSKIKK
jgi:hypothetical protein